MKVGDLFQNSENEYVECVYVSGTDTALPNLVVVRTLIPYTDGTERPGGMSMTTGYYTHEEAMWVNESGTTITSNGDERKIICNMARVSHY